MPTEGRRFSVLCIRSQMGGEKVQAMACVAQVLPGVRQRQIRLGASDPGEGFGHAPAVFYRDGPGGVSMNDQGRCRHVPGVKYRGRGVQTRAVALMPCSALPQVFSQATGSWARTASSTCLSSSGCRQSISTRSPQFSRKLRCQVIWRLAS